MAEYLILGCGYTGRRVVERLLPAGARVIATTRDPGRLRDLSARGCEVLRVDILEPRALRGVVSRAGRGCRVLLSVPTIQSPGGLLDPTPEIVDTLGDRPRRVVYLSTTGVYGNAKLVDETTLIAPVTHRQRLRVAAEEAVTGKPWASMILRPAAIYGPGRGVHAAMRQGRFRLAGDGSNFVSRTQVDDLAALAVAALQSSAIRSPAPDPTPHRPRHTVSIRSGLGAGPVQRPQEAEVENPRIVTVRPEKLDRIGAHQFGVRHTDPGGIGLENLKRIVALLAAIGAAGGAGALPPQIAQGKVAPNTILPVHDQTLFFYLDFEVFRRRGGLRRALGRRSLCGIGANAVCLRRTLGHKERPHRG